MPGPPALIFHLESLVPGAEAYGRIWPGEESAGRSDWVAGAGQKLKPIAGAAEFFEARRGSPGMAIMTRLPLKAGGELIKAMGWRRVFDVYIGAEHLGRGASDADMIALAISRLRRDPADCIAIETRPALIGAAKQAGARTCGVGRGWTAWRLRRAGADRVIPKLSDLD